MMTAELDFGTAVPMWHLIRLVLVFMQELEKYVCCKCSAETRYVFSACPRPTQDVAHLLGQWWVA